MVLEDDLKLATRREHLFVQLKDPISERITVPEIVKEPAIQFGLAQCSLNFSHPFCWRLLCAHWCDKSEAKSGERENINTSHENGRNVTATRLLCTNENTRCKAAFTVARAPTAGSGLVARMPSCERHLQPQTRNSTAGATPQSATRNLKSEGRSQRRGRRSGNNIETCRR